MHPRILSFLFFKQLHRRVVPPPIYEPHMRATDILLPDILLARGAESSMRSTVRRLLGSLSLFVPAYFQCFYCFVASSGCENTTKTLSPARSCASLRSAAKQFSSLGRGARGAILPRRTLILASSVTK
jgi:hypothetical protein